VLDNAKVRRAFGITLPDWEDELGRAFAELPLSTVT
jgi:dTDP-4-dehydrorhamnose reductase